MSVCSRFDAEWASNGAGHPPRVVFQPKLIVRRCTAPPPPVAD
jgi:hypothetical protein